MPKRKRDDKKRRITQKIRRLEKRLHRIYEDSSDSSIDEDRNESDHQSPRHITPPIESDTEIPMLPLSDSDYSVADSTRPRSMIISAQVSPNNAESTPSAAAPSEPVPSTSTQPTLPPDILEALGDPKTKEEVFGPPIPEEIAKRWGRVLVDGLTKEQKQQMEEKYLIPDNFRLAKAPLLNPEITHVLSDAARTRDKLMEKSQNQLGRGIAELTNLAATVIKEDLSKVEMLKKISEISQIFLDLHYEDTKRRRKLITASLDKKFLYMVTEVKRDSFLFGANLGEKIKASKTAERSGLQIRRNDTAASSTFRKSSQQGNWRGPPRTQGQRTNRQGGSKGRYSSQQNRRPPPSTDRAPRTTKTTPKTPKY